MGQEPLEGGHQDRASGERAPQPGISRFEALAMWTRDEAHVLRWDDSCSLAPSYHADLIVVDRNPLECPIEDLPSTQMHAKLLGGECVHGKL